jgi:hypothetical protein
MPSHCGIKGNERVDELAKIATRLNQLIVFPTLTITFHKAYSKHYMAKEWNKEWKTTREKLHLFAQLPLTLPPSDPHSCFGHSPTKRKCSAE